MKEKTKSILLFCLDVYKDSCALVITLFLIMILTGGANIEIT